MRLATFSEIKQQFDTGPGSATALPTSLVPIDGQTKTDIVIRNALREPLEEYYKWQFLYTLIHTGLFAKDYIGAEIRFPKGSKGSLPIKLDAAIFDDGAWLSHYNSFWHSGNAASLEWLNEHLLCVIEFKKNDKQIEKVFTTQIKPAMREKEPATAYVLGIYYDSEKLYLFQRRGGLYLRYDEAKNQKGDSSKAADLDLHLPDPYIFIPSFAELTAKVHRPSSINRSNRVISDLDRITSIATVQVKNALSDILRALDRSNLVNQRGYEILIQTLALKIFDEKRNEKYHKPVLDFYVTEAEASFASLAEPGIQSFIARMERLWTDAETRYPTMLATRSLDWKMACSPKTQPN